MKRRDFFPRPTPFNPHLLSIPPRQVIIVDSGDLGFDRNNLGGRGSGAIVDLGNSGGFTNGGLDLGNGLGGSGNVQVVGLGNSGNGYDNGGNGYDNGRNGYGNGLNGGNGYENGGNGYRNGGNGYENGGNGYGNGGNGYGNDFGNGGIAVGNGFTNGGNVGVLPKVVNANTNVGVEQDYPILV